MSQPQDTHAEHPAGVDSENRNDELRQKVREAYAEVARADTAGECCGVEASCCGTGTDVAISTLISTRLGYSQTDIEQVPSGADMGLGCGNPTALAGGIAHDFNNLLMTIQGNTSLMLFDTNISHPHY